MPISLPPVSISLLADVSKLTAGVRQAEQIINQAAGQVRPMQIRVDGAGATREVTALVAQLRTLTTEMRNQENANNQQRASIAAMVAQQAALRAQLSQTIENLRANGASARELATANGTLRTSMLTATAAIAEQRKELASGVAAQAQYRGAISQTRDQLRQLEGDTNRAAAAQRAQSSSGSSGRGVSGGGAGSTLLTGAVLGVGAMAGREAFNLVTAGAGEAMHAIIGFNSSMEQSKIAFTTFLGGAEQANAFLAQLTQFAIATPFEFPQLVEASKRMLAFGFSAQQVIPLLTSVGNAAAGLSSGNAGIETITLALGQIQAKGHVAGQELLQLQNAGVNTGEIMALIGKETGQTTEQVKKLGEDGKLSATTFIAAFQEWSKQKFGDMMEKQSHTFKGAMNNIHDAAVLVLSKMGAPLFTALSRAANAVADFTQTAQFARWANAATAAVQGVISFLGQLLSMAGTVAGALGFKMPKIDMAKPDTGAIPSQEPPRNEARDAENAATQAAARYKAEVTAAEEHLKGINHELNGVKDQQDAITNQIADIKQGYADQIQPLERQIAVINRLSDAEKARAVRRNELEGQEIQLKLDMPDTSGIDAAIQQLNRDKQDLGKFDSSQWDTALSGLHEQLNQIAHEDTKTLDHAMQAVQESLYELGRENTKALDEQIAGVQKNIADLGKHATDGVDAQIQGLRDQIDGLSTVAIDDLDRQAKALKERVAGISTASIDAIDKQVQGLRDKIDAISTASIDALDAQLAGLQERLKGFNTDALDRQIEGLKAKMNEPAPDTSGMTNQLTLLASQLGGPGDQAARQQFAGLSAQKAGILSAQALRQNAFKQQLASLEAERTAQKLANDDAKATIQNQIDGIEAQKKGLVDLNTERRKGWEAEIKALELAKRGEVERNAATKAGLESEIKAIEDRKQGLVDANTEAKKGWESQIKGLEATKKGIEAGIASQKEAMQAQLDDLQATKKGIDDERANRRDALQDQLHGLQETKRLADEDRANRRQGIQEQIDGLTKEKAAAKAVFDQNIAAIDENIRALTRQKEDALAPYKAALDRIGKEQEIIRLLDQQDALTRKIAEAPLKERIDALKLAEEDELRPLQRKLDILGAQTRELESQKRHADQAKADAEAKIKAMIPPDPPKPPPGAGGGAQDFIGPIEKTGIQAALERAKQWLDDNKAEIVSVLTEVADTVSGIVGRVIGDFGDLYNWGKAHKQDIKEFFGRTWEEVVVTINLALGLIEKSIKVAGDVANQDWKKAWRDLFDGTSSDSGKVVTVYDEFGQKTGTSTEKALFDLKTKHKTYQDNLLGDYQRWWDQYMGDNDLHWNKWVLNSSAWLEENVTGTETHQSKLKQKWDETWSYLRGNQTTYDTGSTEENRLHLDENGNLIDAHHKRVNMSDGSFWNDFRESTGKNLGDVRDKFDEIFGEKGAIDRFFTAMPGKVADMVRGMGSAFGALGDAMRGPINEGIGLINGFLKGVEGAIRAVGNFFDLGPLKDFSVVQIGTIQGGASRGGGGGGGDAALAAGTDDWRGGPAIIGEAGKEFYKTPGAGWQMADKPMLLDLPTHATVLPNNVTEQLLAAGVPGFAFGLGDILGGAKDLLGDAKDKLAGLLGMGIEKVTSAVTDHIPHLDLPGMMKPVGESLVGSAAKGVVDLIKSLWGKLHHDAPKGSGGAGGLGIAGSGDLIAAILAATSDTAEQTAMLFGAFIESSGQNIAQRGGGPGAGYWQIEAGPGGQYAGQVDPYDARAAARFMEADYRAAMRYYDGHDLKGSLAQVVFHAERPASFYGNDQIANAWDAIQQYLVKGGGIVGTGQTSGSGQFVNPVPGIRAVQGSWTHGGTHDREAAVDWAAPYGTLIHAVDSGRAYTVWNGDGATGNTGIIDHGNGWMTYYGHVSDFGEGGFNRDAIVGHTGSPERDGGAGSGAHLHFAMRLNGGYERPEDNIPGIFGLANGGFFPANMPNLAVIGEGAHPEIASPVPIMKQSVKDAITELGRDTGLPARAANRRVERGSEEITVVFEAGSIAIDKDGTPTVNRKPLTLRQARIEAGIAG